MVMIRAAVSKGTSRDISHPKTKFSAQGSLIYPGGTKAGNKRQTGDQRKTAKGKETGEMWRDIVLEAWKRMASS